MWEEETLNTVGNQVFSHNLVTFLQFLHIDKQLKHSLYNSG